jgi:hypothetical protein
MTSGIGFIRVASNLRSVSSPDHDNVAPIIKSRAIKLIGIEREDIGQYCENFLNDMTLI